EERLVGGFLKNFVGNWLGICAMAALPLLGCSGSSDGGDGGAAGTGGAAGNGGIGGSGGIEPGAEVIWSGFGDTGPGAPWVGDLFSPQRGRQHSHEGRQSRTAL
ncbi:MAG: hypothetical protein WCB63_15840, partial [Polyangiales bacterium]